ncbi:alpha/beta fold hydrolase [Vibrio sp. ZSDZ34]|uniref:Alpha/beta fold hydrolase n=1 Tax=Vibrio gelatinilyticus TaxID=2893468 RepID=A0A9X1WBT5_9VIBR|nr:alpha/beta fold hydrolase [Vibrio gelatinilyticus]MCJ2376490.1 alpha/beta fold hydrolase [Vibrio gelatinilyticus]
MSFFKFLFLALLMSLAGCTHPIVAENPEMYSNSGSIAPYSQETFEEYVSETTVWLNQNRVFHGAGEGKELDAVAPYQIIPSNPNGHGILLVHGLGDSPYSFIDIAPVLADHGYLVRVMLLPGHGSRPADLENPDVEDWYESVAHQVSLLEGEVDNLWLGGFSTGTNLVTKYAAESSGITGLVLFSPAFTSKDPLVKYSSFASRFVDWVSLEKEENYTRYDSLSMSGAALYYKTTVSVNQALQDNTLPIPALLLVTEQDELIDTLDIYQTFATLFHHPRSELMWFGDTTIDDSRVVKYPMTIPDLYIQNGSHISVLFSPENDLYGRRGIMRQCGGSNEGEIYVIDCPRLPTLSYTAWGLFEKDAIMARLSWNPYFEPTMTRVLEFMQKTDADL